MINRKSCGRTETDHGKSSVEAFLIGKRSFTMALFFTLQTVFFCTTVFADVDTAGKYNIGIGAGFITGYGLSYRQWFNRFGVQCTVSPFYDTDNSSSSTTISFGATALAKIKEARYVNLIAYLGPHFYYHDYSEKNVPSFDSPSTRNLFIGGGPGLDFHFLNLSLTLMFGYCFRYQFADDHFGTNFSGECGFYYSF